MIAATLSRSAWSAHVFAQNSNLNDHDQYIHDESERSTQYRNNADDYPKPNPSPSTSSSAPAYAAPISTPYQRNYEANIETDADHTFVGARLRSAAGDLAARFILAQCYYDGVGTQLDKRRAYEEWNRL